MSSTIERTTLTAPDISCSHCVATINKAVGGLDGVRTVSADEQTKQVRIEFERVCPCCARVRVDFVQV